jgi:hypothetical protein
MKAIIDLKLTDDEVQTINGMAHSFRKLCTGIKGVATNPKAVESIKILSRIIDKCEKALDDHQVKTEYIF